MNQPIRQEDGTEQQHMLGQGQYDVVVDSGPAYSTLREMSVERLGILATAQPDLVRYFSDYWTKDMDIPHAEEISARLATAVPPEALAATKDDNPETRVAALQTQLQQLGTQFQALQQELQQSKQTEQVSTQQLALAEKTVADMKVRLDNKTLELEVDRLKAQLQHQVDTEKNQIDWEELRLKYGMQAAELQQAAGHNGQDMSDD